MPTAPVGRFDVRAVLDGAAVAAMIAVPVQIIARLIVDEDEGSGWSAVLTLIILAALVLGAGVAAWRQDRETPLSHGIVTATGVFVAIQVVFSIVKVVQGDDIHWGRIVTSFGLSMVAGVIGGMLGQSLIRRGLRPTR